MVGGLGIAAVTELAVTRDLKLVTLSAAEVALINSQHPAYSGYAIPGATYKGIDNDIQALGIWSAVVVHQNMSEALAYQLTCAVYAHHGQLLKVSPVATATTVANIHQLPAVPLHPGTQRFLDSGASDGDCSA